MAGYTETRLLIAGNLTDNPLERGGRMMWTKLCGFRNPEEAAFAAAAGADAIGLNFYPESVRSIEATRGAEIVAAVAGRAQCVGLFVDEPVEALIHTANVSNVDSVQLHGNESPEYLQQVYGGLPGRGIIKAFNIDNSGLGHVGTYLETCSQLGCLPWACLVDAFVPGEPGGTGQTAPWSVVVAEYLEAWPPLILAGGLSAENVAEAVETVQPWGVDVASGVEHPRGVKDRGLVEQFLQVTRTL